MSGLLVNKSDSDISNADLLEGLQAGNTALLAILYDRYSPIVYGLITRRVADEKLAEQFLQKTFIDAISNLSSFNDSGDSLTLWLCKRARLLLSESLPKSQFIETGKIQLGADTVPHKEEGEHQLTALDLIWHLGYTYEDVAAYWGVSIKELRRIVRMELQNHKKNQCQ